MRKSFQPAILAALLAVAATGPALADDNGMTPGYGDSWAQLQAHNPAASTTPPYSLQQNGVVLRPSETVVTPEGGVVVTPSNGAVLTPPNAVVVTPAPSEVVVTPAPAAPETELNTGSYIDSNGNPVVPPANARPVR
jgi:hypothetical protein